MRIAVVGAGALGGFYGAMLAHAGYDVHFLMRRDYQTVKQNGLMVHSCRGDFHLPRVNCYQDVHEIGPVDLVLIGLKTTANDKYEQLISPLLSARTTLLTAQNGLGNEELLAQLFDARRVAGGLAFLCVNRRAEGIIDHLDYGFMHIGNFQRGPDEKLRRLAQMLNNSHVDGKIVENLALDRWKKLVWNVPFNGLSALLDQTTDKLVTHPELRRRAWRLMKEVQAGAHAYHLEIGDDFLDLMMSYTEKMKPYKSSMQLDRQARRPMEIDSIIAEPLRRSQAKGLDQPEMQTLYQQLSELDRANTL